MKPAVEVHDLSHRYGARLALDRVAFTVRAREIFGLLGPNGGGKTTLFKILSTQLAPQAGAVRVFGFDVATQARDVRRLIGVVFQSESLDGKLTVAENLRHQGHLYGLWGRLLGVRIEELLDRFGLRDRAAERAETLSGGLRRRREIAKAVLHRPALLLLDEPTTGLDVTARRETWAYLNELRVTEGVTVMLTTHILDEAEECDRIAILDRGRVVALDAPPVLKSEIGGDVVSARARSPERLGALVRERFKREPLIVGDTVRVEHNQGHIFIRELIEDFPGEIEAVTLARPTLEDVFIQRTGHLFTEQSNQ